MLRVDRDIPDKAYLDGEEQDVIYEDGFLEWAHPDLPQITSFSITPDSSTSASQLVSGSFELAAAATTYVDAINASGVSTRALVSRNRRTGTFSFTVTQGEDYRFVLTATNTEGTVTQTVIYQYHVNGAITSMTIQYGSQTLGLQQIIVTVVFRGKELERATFDRPGIRPIDVRSSHQLTHTGVADYTYVYRDAVPVGAGTFTYTFSMIVNGTPFSRSVTTRSL